tara:strand:- start:1209 stop:1403 length:195 start_codon:yes stop_codon:yes gene_type:complete
MIDTDKYGMTNEELLERFSNLSVDDYKDLLAEVKRLREGIEHALILSRDNNERVDKLRELMGWI